MARPKTGLDDDAKTDPRIAALGGAEPPLPPLRPRRDSGVMTVWSTAPPLGAESVRWQTIDGRWVSISLGSDEAIGQVIVTTSWGSRETVDSYEGALALAQAWRK